MGEECDESELLNKDNSSLEKGNKENDENSCSDKEILANGDFCRYCYLYTENDHNMSVCLCKGTLCKNCLIQELLLTSSRGDGKMKCSVCNHVFEIEDLGKKNGCAVIANFVPFCLRSTCPCASPCLVQKKWYPPSGPSPETTSFVVFAVLSAWIFFTATFDYAFGPKIGSIVRAFIFLLDVVAIYQVYSLAHGCAARRWKNFFTVYFVQANIFRAGLCLYFIFLIVSLYGERLKGEIEQNSQPEVVAARVMLFSLEWFTFVSCSMSLAMGLFYWIEMVMDFNDHFRKTRVVSVEGKGPFELLPCVLE